MPRSPNGTYTLPIAAFAPGGLIKSADLNSDYSDIATALTQSLATNGVSAMSAPLIGFGGTVVAPGYTFTGALKTGFYLSGANAIGLAINGVQSVAFNADNSVSFSGAISAPIGLIPPGTIVDYGGATAPAGWVLCFGQAISRTTYAALFLIIGTAYGVGDGTTTFNVPDYRGRTGFGKDNMGGVQASRITVGGGNFDATVLGAVGGSQLHGLTANEQASMNVSVSGTLTGSTNTAAQTGGTTTTGGGGFSVAAPLTTTNYGVTVSGTMTGTATGGGATHTILNPTIIVSKIIFAGV